jgi:hypothetical protein
MKVLFYASVKNHSARPSSSLVALPLTPLPRACYRQMFASGTRPVHAGGKSVWLSSFAGLFSGSLLSGAGFRSWNPFLSFTEIHHARHQISRCRFHPV